MMKIVIKKKAAAAINSEVFQNQKDIILENIILQKNTKKKMIIIKNGFKLGQKYKTPDLNNPLRKFYTSLLYQKNDSEMALKWCLEYGLLDDHMIDYAFTLVSFKNISLSKKSII